MLYLQETGKNAQLQRSMLKQHLHYSITNNVRKLCAPNMPLIRAGALSTSIVSLLINQPWASSAQYLIIMMLKYNHSIVYFNEKQVVEKLFCPSARSHTDYGTHMYCCSLFSAASAASSASFLALHSRAFLFCSL